MTFTKPNDGSLNPFTLVMLAIMIGGALFGLNKVSTWFAPIILIVSCLAMTAIYVSHNRDQKKASLQISSVKYEQLAQTNLLQYVPWLKDNVRGQDQVIDEIAANLQQRLGLARAGRTLGNYLLVGPTGTGKTFLAQLIAQAVFPNSEPLDLFLQLMGEARLTEQGSGKTINFSQTIIILTSNAHAEQIGKFNRRFPTITKC